MNATPTTHEARHAVIIGGHGKVALLLAPMLISAGFTVDSVFRNPDHEAEVAATGATPVHQDITELDAAGWDNLFSRADVVIWSAGAGGKGGVEATYAIDRDCAIESMKAAERQATPPRYLMVSSYRSLAGDLPEDNPLYNYRKAKKEADRYLMGTDLDYVVLCPTGLTLEPAQGITVVPDGDQEAANGHKTSRELVAQVAAYVAATGAPHRAFIHFFDGPNKLDSALSAS